MILEDEQSLFQLDDVSISRMIVCGKCPDSTIDYDKSKQAFRISISALADKIDRYDEWGHNPEVVHERRMETSRKYREDHKEEIRNRISTSRTDQRIQKLKDQIGGTDGNTS